MNRKFARHVYLLIVAAAVAVLALSAYFFTRYLEKQRREIPEISTYLSLETVQTTEPPAEAKASPTPAAAESIPGSSSANEILQRLCESINDVNSSQDNYHAFARGQLDDISLEEYQLYVKLLQNILRGRVNSYSTMTYSERRLTMASMLEHDPDLAAFLDNASFHWLEYRAAGEERRMPILLSRNEQGKSYLSREWLKSCLELRNFASLYFGAIREQNFDAVQRLVYSQDKDKTVLKQKTDRLLDFYAETVIPKDIGAAEVISLRMDSLTFALPLYSEHFDPEEEVAATFSSAASSAPAVKTETYKTEEQSTEGETAAEKTKQGEEPSVSLSPSETSAEPVRTSEASETPETGETSETAFASEKTEIAETSETREMNAETSAAASEPLKNEKKYHYVTIYKNQGYFIAVDGVPSDKWKRTAAINSKTETLAKIGNSYTAESLRDIFGMPEAQYRFSFVHNAAEKEYFRLLFPNIEMVVSRDKDKPGKLLLEAVTLRKPGYLACGSYTIGDKLEKLYKDYLYIDSYGFSYLDAENNHVQMYLNDKNRVKMIVLQSGSYRAELLLQQLSPETPDELILEPSPTPSPSPSPTPVPETAQEGEDAEVSGQTADSSKEG